MEMNKTEQAFGRLYEIIGRLRAPDGCPWDRKQTPSTMRQNLVEETFEAVDAITQNDATHIKEELGDVILNAAMIAYMFEQKGDFSIANVLNEVSEKIIRRHPHVFTESSGSAYSLQGGVKTAEDVLVQWSEIKQKAEGRKTESVLDSVETGLPPLMKAYKLQKKASKVGFDWENIDGVYAKINEEIEEVKNAQNEDEKEAEVGDLLFAVINYARHLGVDPTIALSRTNEKFKSRFNYMESKMHEQGLTLESANSEKMNEYWDEAKSI